MVVQFFDGSETTDGTEQNLFDITADKHFALWLFTHNMLSGDKIQVRVNVKDQNTTTMRKYIDTEIADAQTKPAFFIPFVPTKQYKVSIQRTAGTDRLYTWQRIEA